MNSSISFSCLCSPQPLMSWCPNESVFMQSVDSTRHARNKPTPVTYLCLRCLVVFKSYNYFWYDKPIVCHEEWILRIYWFVWFTNYLCYIKVWACFKIMQQCIGPSTVKIMLALRAITTRTKGITLLSAV